MFSSIIKLFITFQNIVLSDVCRQLGLLFSEVTMSEPICKSKKLRLITSKVKSVETSLFELTFPFLDAFA